MGRRESRENAMKLLYQVQIQRDDIDEQINRYLEEHQIEDGTEKAYILDVVKGAMEHQEDIDSLITQHAKGWSLSRMSKVDLGIMRLSIFEMSYREDIPVNVSINEAVELAKKYSGEQSKTFINGLLGKVWVALSDKTSEGVDEKTGEPQDE